jgi:hypothetical protein
MAQAFKSLIAIGPRVRKSPLYEATKRYGVNSFTIYNHISCRRFFNPQRRMLEFRQRCDALRHFL